MNEPKREEIRDCRIGWRCTTNGRTGTGTLRFTRERAAELAAEMNVDYPGIVHWVVADQTTETTNNGKGN